MKDMASDAIAGCMSVTTGSKRNRVEALAMLTKARKAVPAMVFLQEEDQLRCQKDMEGKDFKQLEKKLNMYVNMLLYVPIFQGRQLARRKYLDDAAVSRFLPGQLGRLYQYDSKEGRYYKEVMSVPKLLLVNGELLHE
ncbi:MAG: hypothetical protein ACLTL7_27125 [Enterocloster bolteae]